MIAELKKGSSAKKDSSIMMIANDSSESSPFKLLE
jgi:hypothetical protein